MGGVVFGVYEVYLDCYCQIGVRQVIGYVWEVIVCCCDGLLFLVEFFVSEMDINGQCIYIGNVCDIFGCKVVEVEWE